jgi:translation initiation factor IF-1
MSEQQLPTNDKVLGVVTEALPNTMFRVELADGVTLIAYLAGKMRMHRIKVLVGDKVEVLIDPYGGKGRITRRM